VDLHVFPEMVGNSPLEARPYVFRSRRRDFDLDEVYPPRRLDEEDCDDDEEEE
jgi:hypothetical protein